MMLVLYYLNMVQFEGLITLVLAVEHSAQNNEAQIHVYC